jgi:hypothetical protein
MISIIEDDSSVREAMEVLLKSSGMNFQSSFTIQKGVYNIYILRTVLEQ